MSEEKIVSDFYAVVEVMGHSQYAGRVSEHTALGVPLVRVEVPAVNERPGFDVLLGAASIFRVTPCTQAVAKEMAARFSVRPLNLVAMPDTTRALAFDDRDEYPDDE